MFPAEIEIAALFLDTSLAKNRETSAGNTDAPNLCLPAPGKKIDGISGMGKIAYATYPSNKPLALMARNIEIKARIASVESLLPLAANVADEGPIAIFQDDTFFPCPNGRLKLRAFSDHDGQLIFYRRPDSFGPKESFYVISPISSPDTLRQALALAYGEAGRVIKHRTLFLAGRTRIHLDRVEGLGDFLELEVVLADGEANETGASVADELLDKLGIARDQLIDGAYVDMLAKSPSINDR
jgi:predicted adenylyl cyclase CyaB